MKYAPAKKKAKIPDTHTVLCLRMRRLIMARSPWNHSSAAKAMLMTPKPTRRPITSDEDQAFSTPPHWKARMKEMTAPIMRAVPGTSIWRSFSRRVALAGTACAGVRKKRKIMAEEAPPMGRLMLKGRSVLCVPARERYGVEREVLTRRTTAR